MRKKKRIKILLSIVILLVALGVIWIVRSDPNAIAAVTFVAGIIELIVVVLNPFDSHVNLHPPEGAANNDPDPGLPLIPPLFDGALVSRFAVSRRELDTVLQLRRAFFAERIVSSDESYIRCWERNHYVFKIMYVQDDNYSKPLGYWGLIPINKSAYDNFLRGRISHEDMLMKEAVDWCEIDPKNVYIYVIGAVLPEVASAISPSERLYVKLMASRVLIDMFDFAEAISQLLTFKGICGYPSRAGGADVFSKLSFRNNGIYIDGDEDQPVSYVYENDIGRLVREIKYYSDRHGHIVTWDEDDKKRFLIRMNTCVEIGKQRTDSH